MLTRRSDRQARRGTVASVLTSQTTDKDLDRRSFLRRSGLAAGSLTALGSLPLTSIRQAEAGPPPPPGATVRDDVLSERRLRYPQKLVDGQWKRLSWDQAIDEIGDKLLDIRQKSGPDSVYWRGAAKFTNEAAYLNRKLAAFWGTNNSDHQARICHSTTVTGVANTWGYGAMTNSYNDIRN